MMGTRMLVVDVDNLALQGELRDVFFVIVDVLDVLDGVCEVLQQLF